MTTLDDLPVTGEWREAAEVGDDVARAAWADAARDELLEVAGRYQSVITTKDLALQVQQRSGIRTGQRAHYWIGDILGRVAADSADRGEPLLSSLCVNAEGSVGDIYATIVLEIRGETLEDPDVHAAQERLALHQLFDAKGLPEEGGNAMLTPKLAASRARARKVRAMERVVPTCPTCYTELPATGHCNYCD
jgi:hypothetical protein